MSTIDADEVEQIVRDMARALKGILADDLQDCVMAGLQTGGYWIAERLHKQLGLTTPLGSISSRFYRDDFDRIGLHPNVRPSSIPAGIEDRTVVLVDDVLYTGRTIRAAMNELFDHGRPKAVRLAVLVDRGGHELPIAPDVVGRELKLPPHQHVKLAGPDTLQLDIIERYL